MAKGVILTQGQAYDFRAWCEENAPDTVDFFRDKLPVQARALSLSAPLAQAERVRSAQAAESEAHAFNSLWPMIEGMSLEGSLVSAPGPDSWFWEWLRTAPKEDSNGDT